MDRICFYNVSTVQCRHVGFLHFWSNVTGRRLRPMMTLPPYLTTRDRPLQSPRTVSCHTHEAPHAATKLVETTGRCYRHSMPVIQVSCFPPPFTMREDLSHRSIFRRRRSHHATSPRPRTRSVQSHPWERTSFRAFSQKPGYFSQWLVSR